MLEQRALDMRRKLTVTLTWMLSGVILLAGVSPFPAMAWQGEGEEPETALGDKIGQSQPEMYDDWHQPIPKPGTAPQAAASSDHFGYVWDDTAGLNWVDATSGTEVFIEGQTDRDDNFTEAINLGFDFKFYERTFNKLFIGTNGFISFKEGSDSFSNRAIPDDTPPNNLLAVFWDDLDLGNGKVYYQRLDSPSGGSFVVEWHQVNRYGGTEHLTFEIVLYENGEILFQYLDLNGILNEATVGIEDGDGIDGLQYLHNAPGLSSGKAIRFTRPGPAPRVKTLPAYRSGFSIQRQTSFEVRVRNTNEEGSDVFDLRTVLSDPAWTVAFYSADGITPLEDTDGDGIVDTGVLNYGETLRIVLGVSAPAFSGVGAYVEIEFQAISSDDPDEKAITRMQAAIPADFAQAFADSQSGIFLDLLWRNRTDTSQVESFFTGNTLSLNAIQGGNYFYAWERNGQKTDGGLTSYFSDIEYVIVNSLGSLVRTLDAVTDNGSVATPYLLVNARYPMVASLKDGKIGVLWAQYQLDITTSSTNSNIYFAILDATGEVAIGPVNVTNNTGWRGLGNDNVPSFNNPRLVATGDGRFFLAWIEGRQGGGGESSSVYYAVYGSEGEEVKAPTAFAQSDPGSTLFMDPALTEVSGGRVLIAYSLYDRFAKTYTVIYAVLRSNGSTVKSASSIPGSSGWRVDAVQYGGGNILLSWSNPTTDRIAYAVFSGDDYSLFMGPSDLPMLGSRIPDYVSLTISQGGYAVLSWMDAEWKDYLYYSLIDGSGMVLTPPMIFVSGQASNPLIQTSFSGQGVAPYEGRLRTFFPRVSR